MSRGIVSSSIVRGLCITMLLLAFVFTGTSYGAGFQLFNELSARGMGNGGTMTARTDTAESAWFNPASVALMKHPQALTGMALVMPYLALQMGDHEYRMKKMAYPLPYAYVVYPVGDRVGISLSANVPYGLTTEWPADWPGRYRAIKTDLRCLFVTPSISYAPTDCLSFAVGAQIVRATAEMTKAVTPALPTLTTKITGHDTAVGYLVSAMLKPARWCSFGVIFRSEVHIKLDGEAKYNEAVPGFYRSDVQLPVTLPATVSVGLNLHPVPRWHFGIEYLWTGWSSYKSLDFFYYRAPGTGLPGTVSLPRNWDDTYSLRFSVAHNISKAWIVRAAYVYDKTPIDDQYRDPSLPTNDRHLFNIGCGYTHNNLGVDVAYTFLRMEHSHPSPATPELYGTYKGLANIINVDLRWRF